MGLDSYKIKYAKNFITQALATGSGLLSLFLVVPFLSGDQTLYGIYSVCVSLTIFFNYADLGFQTAGQKYAGEHYARGDKDGEIRIIGFTTWMLLVFCIFIAICLLPIVIYPSLIISDGTDYIGLARTLIIILILSAPFAIIKRVCSIVFNIRIEQYKYYIIVLISQIIKLLSVLYFFRDGHYELVEYYFFIQLIDVISAILLYTYILTKYEYGIGFVKYIKWDSAIWHMVKQMAFVSLFTTITWVLFYELDIIVLSIISSPSVVALYNTAFTLLTLSRNYFGIIYSSFAARYNHFVGLEDYASLRQFFQQNISKLYPVVFYPILIIVVFSSPFVSSWVGNEYAESFDLARILLIGTLLSFISYPSNQYLVATNKIKSLYIVSAILPFIFWLGVASTYFYIGILSFAVFKTIAQLLSAGYSYKVSCQYQGDKWITNLFAIFINYKYSTILCLTLSTLGVHYAHFGKSLANLMFNILIMIIIFIFSVLIAYWNEVSTIYRSIVTIKKN